MKYIKRYLERTLRAEVERRGKKKNVILLKGARQVGKTTMLENMFSKKDATFINLSKMLAITNLIDKTNDFGEFCFVLERHCEFIPNKGKLLIIDEAQTSNRLGNYVRFMKEDWPNQPVVLTGSTLSDLFNNCPKPVGRVTEFTLRPFNFLEFLDALGEQSVINRIKAWKISKPHSELIHGEILELLYQYLTIGGLPAVVGQYLQERKGDLWKRELENIIAYYQRDIKGIKKSQLTTLFEQTLKRLAVTTGSQTKDSTIVKSSSPGYRYVKDLFAILEDWKLVIKIDAILSKYSKIGSVAPKRYLFDHGVRNYYIPWSMKFIDSEDLSSNMGSGIIEQFVLTELLSLNPTGPINYWLKTHQSGEVDLLFSHKNSQIGIEVKSAKKLDMKHLTSLKAFLKLNSKASGLLLNLSRGKIVNTNLTNIPTIPVYQVFQYFYGC